MLVLGASATRGDFEGVCNMASMSQTTVRNLGGSERIEAQMAFRLITTRRVHRPNKSQ